MQLRVFNSGDKGWKRSPTDLDRAGVLRVVQQPHGAVAFPVQTPDAAAHQSAQHLRRRAGEDACKFALRSRQRPPRRLLQHLLNGGSSSSSECAELRRRRWCIVLTGGVSSADGAEGPCGARLQSARIGGVGGRK